MYSGININGCIYKKKREKRENKRTPGQFLFIPYFPGLPKYFDSSSGCRCPLNAYLPGLHPRALGTTAEEEAGESKCICCCLCLRFQQRIECCIHCHNIVCCGENYLKEAEFPKDARWSSLMLQHVINT